MSTRTYADPSRNTSRRWPVWKWLLLTLPILLAGALILLTPWMSRTRGGPGHELTRAISNMRQIGLALFEFENDFESFPNDTTIELVQQRFPNSLIPMGTSSSNDFFHQLFAAEIVESRSIFYGYGVSNHRHEEWAITELPLPSGSCGFAYIIHDTEMRPPNIPLMVYPLVRRELIFDTNLCKRWGNRAAVLYADASARIHPIDSKGRIIIDGRDFFDPTQPHWNGNSFRVVWPE